jgi:nucleolar protein 6
MRTRAGGGGKTKHRQAKIGEKNQKLNEQRTRRIHEEEKTKLVKKQNAISYDGIHPSRRARVPDT